MESAKVLLGPPSGVHEREKCRPLPRLLLIAHRRYRLLAVWPMARTESSHEDYMITPGEVSPEPVLNLPELLARVENDSELLRELIDIGKVDIPRHISLLREAVAQADMKNIEKSGHTLRGMLSSLAATRAAAPAGHLEQLARSVDTPHLRNTVTIFESEIARLMTELEAYMANIRP